MWKRYKNISDDKRFEFEELKKKYDRKCKHCGYTNRLISKKKVICKHCGNYVFVNDLEEFKYRIKEKSFEKIL